METNEMIDENLMLLCDQFPGVYGVKDLNSIFLYANKEYAKIVGIKNHEDIKGMSDYDMPSAIRNCADTFREQDKLVIANRKPIKTIYIHPFFGEVWKVYIFTKTLFINNEQHVIGTIFHGIEVTNDAIFNLNSVLTQTYSATGTLKNDLNGPEGTKITTRQLECLFYILRGKTIKEIARLLNISHRTVEVHLEQLKLKFNTQSKNQLINRAIEMGFLNATPKGIFNRQLSMIIAD